MTTMLPMDDFLPRNGPSFRRRVLRLSEKLLYWTGLGHLYLKASQLRGAVILTYHSIAPLESQTWIDPRNRISPVLFERQARFLAEHRNVVSLSTLLDAILNGEALPAGTVVITFDDGYRDNLEIAAPILRRYHLPAVLYFPTSVVARGESPWADELYTIFRTRTRNVLHSEEGESYKLTDPKASRLAYQFISKQMVTADRVSRDNALASITSQLAPRERPPRLTLNWQELRTMRDDFPLFSFGLHSANHVDFTSQEEHVVRQELQDCMHDFERELGMPAEHFAYPYNRRNEFTDLCITAAGLRSAVTSGPNSLILPSHDPFNLPRIGEVRSMSLYRFCTSGAYPNLPRRVFFGRA